MVAGALGVFTNAARRTARAEESHPPIGDFVDVDGARVHYVQQGVGPDVVLIHGAGGNLREFTFALMGLLTDRYRVTAFDRPGLGYTDRAPGLVHSAYDTTAETPMQQASMLRTAAEKLGVRAPVVVGHSFGGIVSIAWGLLGDDSLARASALVSLAGIAMPWDTDLGAYYTVNASAFGGVVTVPILSAIVPNSIVTERIIATFAPQPVAEGYIDYIGAPLTLRPDTFRANTRQVAYLLPHVQAMVPEYDRLTLPIELLHGDADTTVPLTVHAEPFAASVPTSNLVVLQGVGHMPHHADPVATGQAIDRAVARAGLR
jgi:pimeloyl-ACP methyl ester carboxylesterase